MPDTLPTMRPNARRERRLWKYLCLAAVVLVYLGLHRGTLDYGVQFDEVYRLNNLIPMFDSDAKPYDQSLFSVPLFGWRVPLVYKSYVSSASIAHFAPMMLFRDLLPARRLLGLTYNLVALVAFLLYLRARLVERSGAATAAMTVVGLLVATSPLLYGTHALLPLEFLVALALSIAVFRQAALSRYAARWLFLLGLVCGLQINSQFYFVWVLAAALLWAFVFQPEAWRSVSRQPAKGAAFLSGLAVGAVNFVAYNLAEGFPLLRTLFLWFFQRSEYNLEPIDFKRAAPFHEDLARKFDGVRHWFGSNDLLQLAVVVSLVVQVAVLLWLLVGKDGRRWREARWWLYPLAMGVTVLLLALVSPNTTRPLHYIYAYSLLAVWLGCACCVAFEVSPRWRGLGVAVSLAPVVLILVLQSLVSSHRMDVRKRAGGTGYFSPAIFDLRDHLEGEEIASEQVWFLQWGLHAQLYFLNRGSFTINSVASQLLGKPRGAQVAALEQLFVERIGTSDQTVYLPLYFSLQGETTGSLEELAETYGGELVLEKTFRERDGRPIFGLYSLDDTPSLKRRILAKEMRSSRVSGSAGFEWVRGAYSPDAARTWIDESAELGVWTGELGAVTIKGYLPESSLEHLERPFEVAVGSFGRELVRQEITVAGAFVVRVEGLPPNEPVLLAVRCSDSVIPSRVGLGPDSRVLGILVTGIRVD